jgi:hypothetical protein
MSLSNSKFYYANNSLQFLKYATAVYAWVITFSFIPIFNAQSIWHNLCGFVSFKKWWLKLIVILLNAWQWSLCHKTFYNCNKYLVYNKIFLTFVYPNECTLKTFMQVIYTTVLQNCMFIIGRQFHPILIFESKSRSPRE